MRKFFITKVIVLSLAVIFVFGVIFLPVLNDKAENDAITAAYMARIQSRCLRTLRAGMNLVPLSANYSTNDIQIKAVNYNNSYCKNTTNFAPVNASNRSGWTDPNERHEGGVYTSEGNRIFKLEETGMLFTETGDLITINCTNQNSLDGSLALHFNEENHEFLDGANRQLATFLDSRLDRKTLRSGGRYTRTIELDTDVYLVNFIGGAVGQTIYITINSTRHGWWIFGRTQFHAYDMNGREIDNRHIELPQPPAGWKGLIPIYNIVTAVQYAVAVSVFEIHERTTLADLLYDISYASYHPWARIICSNFGFVVTENNEEIRVNPRTRQLTDRNGFSLFNRTSGLPIVFYNQDIVIVNRQGVAGQQTVENGVLRDSTTVHQLLMGGTPFHMHIIQTPFGSFDVPVLNHGTDREPDFRLMNGESTDGITIDHAINVDTSTGFWEGLQNAFGGGGFRWWHALALVAGAIILIIFFPVIKPVLIVMGNVLMIPARAIKRKNKKSNRRHENENY